MESTRRSFLKKMTVAGIGTAGLALSGNTAAAATEMPIGKKKKPAAQAQPAPAPAPAPKAAGRQKNRRGGRDRGRPMEHTLRSNGQKDSTEQPSLMKPYYLSDD